METATKEEVNNLHSAMEIANVYRCGKIERDWTSDIELPSNYAITLLHATLFDSIPEYTQKGVSPNKPGNYRIEDIWVGDEDKNFYAHGLDVSFLMREYTSDLDEVLKSLPTSANGRAEVIIHQAAWAYYTFIRIHPFLDGNGRVSRMVMQRILKGGGFKDIVFSQESTRNTKKYADNKERHLDAMAQVDKTGSLVSLEAYLADQLLARYISPAEQSLKQELKSLRDQKINELQHSKERKPISEIWPPFANIDIKGIEV